MVAEDLTRKKPSTSPQILVITDGQPTAYFDEGQLRVEWPNGLGGVSPHAVAAMSDDGEPVWKADGTTPGRGHAISNTENDDQAARRS